MLHPPERRLQLLLAGHAVLSAALACLYLASGDTGVLGALPNSFAKDALFVALSALGAADVRRRGWFALLIALAYVALVAGQVATLLWGGAPDVEVLGLHVSATVALLAWMAVDLVLAAWLTARPIGGSSGRPIARRSRRSSAAATTSTSGMPRRAGPRMGDAHHRRLELFIVPSRCTIEASRSPRPGNGSDLPRADRCDRPDAGRVASVSRPPAGTPSGYGEPGSSTARLREHPEHAWPSASPLDLRARFA